MLPSQPGILSISCGVSSPSHVAVALRQAAVGNVPVGGCLAVRSRSVQYVPVGCTVLKVREPSFLEQCDKVLTPDAEMLQMAQYYLSHDSSVPPLPREKNH